MLFALQHQESAERAERNAAVRATIPNRSEFLLEYYAAKFEGEEHVPARAVISAADQRQFTLSSGDAGLRHAYRVGAGRLFAHKRSRRADHAVHERDVAGKQVWKLRQKQRRAQIAHQSFVEKGAWRVGLTQT